MYIDSDNLDKIKFNIPHSNLPSNVVAVIPSVDQCVDFKEAIKEFNRPSLKGVTVITFPENNLLHQPRRCFDFMKGLYSQTDKKFILITRSSSILTNIPKVNIYKMWVLPTIIGIYDLNTTYETYAGGDMSLSEDLNDSSSESPSYQFLEKNYKTLNYKDFPGAAGAVILTHQRNND